MHPLPSMGHTIAAIHEFQRASEARRGSQRERDGCSSCQSEHATFNDYQGVGFYVHGALKQFCEPCTISSFNAYSQGRHLDIEWVDTEMCVEDVCAKRKKRRESEICEYGRHKKSKKHNLCQHQKRPQMCRECGGSEICEHGRIRRQCAVKPCKGSSICHHGRQKSTCRECGGSGICEHGRQRHQCVECAGTSICPHMKRFSRCVTCGGSELSAATKRKLHNQSYSENNQSSTTQQNDAASWRWHRYEPQV